MQRLSEVIFVRARLQLIRATNARGTRFARICPVTKTERDLPSTIMATRVRHRQLVEEEDAGQLKLGSEFNEAGCLLISEVRYLLENRDKAAPDTAIFNKTLEYVKTFAKFNTTDSAAAVRETLRREEELTQFETAQIANLCPVDADEAKSVVPSLNNKIDDDRLQNLLDEIQTLRKFQT